MLPVSTLLASRLAKRFFKVLLAAGIAIVTVNAVASFLLAERALERAGFRQLAALAVEKEGAVRTWFADARTLVTAQSRLVLHYMVEEEITPIDYASISERDRMRDWIDHVAAPFRDRVPLLMLLDPITGEVVAATDRSEEGRFKDVAPFFARDLTETRIVGPYYSLRKQAPTLMATTPLRHDGALVGLLVAEIALAPLERIIDRVATGQRTVQSYLINTANLFVTQPPLTPDEAVLRKANFTGPVRRCLAGEAGEMRSPDYRGVEALTAYRWIAGPDLCLVSQISVAEALQGTENVTLQYFGAGMLAIMLMALVVALTVPRPIADVRRLAEATARVRGGDFDAHIETRGGDELGDLAENFNAMTDELKRRDRALAEEREKLVAARVEAMKANEAKSRFLANMSHELRTPLNSIIGFSDIMLTGTFGPMENERYRGYVDDIRFSGNHLLEVINDILDLSKIEASMMELEEARVGIPETLEAARTMVAPRAAERGQRLTIEAANNLPDLWADDRRLRQILVNLVGNAVKFSPEGAVIRLSAGMEADGTIALSVADPGVGIAPEDLATVLEPFGQVNETILESQEGTGLGLPLAKRLAELHGGTLEIDSVPGKGTTVTVRLPASRIITSG